MYMERVLLLSISIFNLTRVCAMRRLNKKKLVSLYKDDISYGKMLDICGYVQSSLIGEKGINVCRNFALEYGYSGLSASNSFQSRVTTGQMKGYYLTVNGVDHFKIPCVFECTIDNATIPENKFYLVICEILENETRLYSLVDEYGEHKGLRSFALVEITLSKPLKDVYINGYNNIKKWYDNLKDETVNSLCENLKDVDYQRKSWRCNNNLIKSRKEIPDTKYILNLDSIGLVDIPGVVICEVFYPKKNISDELYWVRDTDNPDVDFNGMIQVYETQPIGDVRTFSIAPPLKNKSD